MTKAMIAASTNPDCQPKLSARVGMIAAPSMPLMFTADWFTPTAVARSCGGNQSMMALTAVG